MKTMRLFSFFLVLAFGLIASPAYTQTISSNKLVINRGALDFEFGGQLSTGLGYGSICPQMVETAKLQKMIDPSRTDVARIVFVLGDSVYDICGKENEMTRFPSTWDGSFHFEALAREVGRMQAINPNVKIVLQVALDGSKKWLNLPANINSQPDLALRAKGIPDYMDPNWRQFAKTGLSELMAAVQNSPYKNSIVGYELFYGRTLDGNPLYSLTAPAALSQFRGFIATKYSNDVSRLRTAWGDTTQTLTFANVMPLLSLDAAARKKALQLAPLFIPGNFPALADTKEFRSIYDAQIISDFAETIKAVSNGNALVGVRSGELFNTPWKNEEGATEVFRTFKFYNNRNIDFYEVWDTYGHNRLTGKLASSVIPLMPPEGLRLLNKKYVLQNDYRVAFEGSASVSNDTVVPGFGFDPSINLSLAKQKRLFSANLTRGLSPYLWEMSYDYSQSWLLTEWDNQKTILKKSQYTERESVAEVAIVVDPEVQKYLSIGFEPIITPATATTPFSITTPNRNVWTNEPGFLTQFLNIPMHSWARIGATTDMLFLDQVIHPEEQPVASRPKDYKVYVFYHTFALSDDSVNRIHQMLKAKGAMGIFVYAAGMMDGEGKANTSMLGNRISTLTKMPVKGFVQEFWGNGTSVKERLTQLKPTPEYESVAGPVPDSELPRWETPRPTSQLYTLFPSFIITDRTGLIPLANYRQDDSLAIAMKDIENGAAIVYSATPHIPPSLLRNLLKRRNVHTFFDAEDLVYANKSFIGFTGDATRSLTLKLPTASALYNVYDDIELSSAASHALNVVADKPYLFFRGTKAAWDALGQ